MQKFGGSGHNVDSATARISLLYDVENDWIADAVFSAYKTAERAQAEQHLNRLVALEIASQSLIIFDRGYPQKELIQSLNQKSGYPFA